MKYILLLRGINVGGKNKVKMEELKHQLANLGFANVISYINSGNLIFESEKDADEAKSSVRKMLTENYDFEILFVLLASETYQKTIESLPDWWNDGSMARRDALFFTDEVNPAAAIERIQNMKLYNETIHYTDIAVFWGKINETEYSKTAYHKQLLAEDFYKKITIRNGNTVQKILSLL